MGGTPLAEYDFKGDLLEQPRRRLPTVEALEWGPIFETSQVL